MGRAASGVSALEGDRRKAKEIKASERSSILYLLQTFVLQGLYIW